MRARHAVAVAFVLVLAVVQLTLLAAPIAQADTRSVEGGSVDVVQIHRPSGNFRCRTSTTCRSPSRHRQRDRSRTILEMSARYP
jgi:hypothetical protein